MIRPLAAGFLLCRAILSVVAAIVLASAASRAAEPQSDDAGASATAVLQQLRTLATTGRVLHVGAHPDDENTQLIAYLSRGRGYDTAYLSITRGDGGQNILGPQFDEKLGVARTQELLAARRIDGGRQFFTRAIDFGFSKNPEETLSIWNHHDVLSDVVRVIRRFRPDILVTRFPVPPGSGGHGHHTASAILALEAFKLAGDPTAFPEQIREGLAPWQPKRILWDVFGQPGPFADRPTIKVNIGGKDPVTSEEFGAIAGRSRAMHKTQDIPYRAVAGERLETFVLLAGDPPTSDLMDGIDATWDRIPGGGGVGQAIAVAIAAFKPADPAASVPTLLAIRRQIAALPADPIVDDKRRQLDQVLQRCLGLEIESRSPWLTVVPGDKIPVTAAVRIRSSLPVRWTSVEYPGGRSQVDSKLKPEQEASQHLLYPVAQTASVTQPYWLRTPASVGMYSVSDPKLIGMPENPPDLPLTYTFEIEGQTLTIGDRLVLPKDAFDQGRDGRLPPAEELKRLEERHRQPGGHPLPVAIVPPVALKFPPGAAVFRPGATTTINLEVIAGIPDVAGTVQLRVPPGWKASAPQSFRIAQQFKSAQLAFDVTAPNATESATIGARAEVGGIECTTDEFTIHYEHIPIQLLQPAAHKRVVAVNVGTRGHSIGYIAGAGDDVPDALRQLGYRVTMLKTDDLTYDRLKVYDAVVIGVRAFNTRADLGPNLPAVFAYVENGGTIVCQYNWSRNLKSDRIAPYSLRLSDRRVTNEDAPVTLLAPDHPILNTPNKITSADFEGWVQERGIYFPGEWDEHFAPILAMSDSGEAPLKGALLVAPYGKGHFVYTSLVFFRELPAGVPGAYRLFANLVSLGK